MYKRNIETLSILFQRYIFFFFSFKEIGTGLITSINDSSGTGRITVLVTNSLYLCFSLFVGNGFPGPLITDYRLFVSFVVQYFRKLCSVLQSFPAQL